MNLGLSRQTVNFKGLPAVMSASSTTPSGEPPGKNQPKVKSRRGLRLWSHDAKEKAKDRFWKQFDGGRGFNGQYWYQRPYRQPTEDPEKALEYAGTAEAGTHRKHEYLNQLGQISKKYEDVDTYLSTTSYTPRRLIVQATEHVRKSERHSTKDWRRRKMEGSVPLALRMAEWALRPVNPPRRGDQDPDVRSYSIFGCLHSFLRILLIGLPLQVLLALPGAEAPWEADQIEDTYLDYPGYHWKWAKHAINPLDQRPGASKKTSKSKVASSKSRLLRPRQLIVYREGCWQLESNPSPDLQYLFISYANVHFSTHISIEGGQQLERMAEYATFQANCNAYWLDYKCRAPKSDLELLTADVNRMCDVIRGSKRVVVMLRDPRNSLRPESPELLMEEWGKRMWTLPEGLLAPGNVHFCYMEDDSFKMFSLNKVEMTARVWKDPPMDDDDPPTRLLAEHYSNNATLGRLEFFASALAALSNREPDNLFTDADLAYALMGLLHYRIQPDETDSLFQALARLSLANDNDRLIERMVCMYPHPKYSFRDLFKILSQKDQYETHLWDIKPLCEVVGVGDEPNTVLLNNCRAIPIRWKQFPRMQYRRHVGFKKTIAEFFVRSGAWWVIAGVSLAWTYAPIILALSSSSGSGSGNNTRPANGTSPHNSTGPESNLSTDGSGNGFDTTLIKYFATLIGAFLAVGFLLSFLGPHSVRRLFGGAVLQTAPHLIGFEGVEEIRKLEKLMFGNCQGRLCYEPSSTLFCLENRHPDRREGLEPKWIKEDPDNPEPPLQGNHQRIFTLVDTNKLTVSIFSAQRPPTVALICGSEGGMLRTILCSWRFSSDCLFKEAVIRMPHDMLELAKAKSWLKLSLGNQEDFAMAKQWEREKLWRKNPEKDEAQQAPRSVSTVRVTEIGDSQSDTSSSTNKGLDIAAHEL